MSIRGFFDKLEPNFEKGGKWEKWYPIYEMFDTFFYAPADTTRRAPFVRDNLDLKRVIIYVWLACIPVALFGMWNLGFQANSAMGALGIGEMDGWRGALIGTFSGHDPSSAWDNFVFGFWHWVPIYIVTFAVGIAWEVLFAVVRGHDVNEGFFATSILFSLTCPPTIPLWMVAIGISFGVVIGKEVFGGTGKNFLNPALTGRAFLFFAYPAAMSGDAVWTAVDGFSGATPLSIWFAGGLDAVLAAGYDWSSAFYGFIQGSVGETSTLVILFAGVFLALTKVASWRIMVGVLIGLVATSALFNMIGSETNPMFSMGPLWHLAVGGIAFGLVFMATDPVSAAMTNNGRWIYGILIGVMTVLIRVVNPAYPEGAMLAILFGNICAPLIDHFVVQANIRRRLRRLAA
ncbi:NADH:ubiquinone reductase (Na(+)-transporting) subunit B [Gammaproteobacteria bacterium]|nr:NADH:ubiquinone reductase (Na(+)-transporting) subunit B [Gammaproteobacteria bacterium]